MKFQILRTEEASGNESSAWEKREVIKTFEAEDFDAAMNGEVANMGLWMEPGFPEIPVDDGTLWALKNDDREDGGQYYPFRA